MLTRIASTLYGYNLVVTRIQLCSKLPTNFCSNDRASQCAFFRVSELYFIYVYAYTLDWVRNRYTTGLTGYSRRSRERLTE